MRRLLPAVILLAAAIVAPSRGFSEAPQTFIGEHHRFFSLLYPEQTDAAFRYTFQPENKAQGSPGKYTLNIFDARTDAALPMDNALYLPIGFQYDARLYSFDHVSSARTYDPSLTLHKLSASVGAGWFITDSLLLTGTFQPGIYSDFGSGFDDRDFKFYGDGKLVYQINPNSQILAGVEVSGRYEDYPVIPYAGIRLLNTDGTLSVSATFPLDARVGYNLNPGLQLYGGIWVTGDTYRASMGNVQQRFSITTQDRRAGGGVVYWPMQNVNLNAEVGVDFNQKFILKTANPGQFDNGNVGTTGYLSVGVGLAF